MNAPSRAIRRAPLIALFSFFLLPCSLFAQGALAPPGTPVPTMKSLDQLEPRTPISSLPFAITQAGSYYLAANLSGTAGISISCNNVSLDLSGFTLAGVSGSGSGIQATTAVSDVRVRNGIVRDWSGAGVDLGQVTNARVEALLATNNGGDGVHVGPGALVTDTIGSQNATAGIEAADNCQITGCVFRLNEIGISAQSACRISRCSTDANTHGGIAIGVGGSVLDCASGFNPLFGISAGDGCTISRCTTRQNISYGIFTGSGCDISDCTASSNGTGGIFAGGFGAVHGCTVSGNSGNGITLQNGGMATGCTVTLNPIGISANFGCEISKCVVRNQTLDGIVANSSCRIVDNNCDSNFNGIHVLETAEACRVEGNHVVSSFNFGITIEGQRNVVVRNTSGFNGVDFGIAANNKVGVIFPAAASAPFAGSDGRGLSSIGSTDPWANLTY